MRNLLIVNVVMSVVILSMTCLAQQTEFEAVTPNVAPSVEFSLEGAVPLVGSPAVVLPSPSMQPYYSPAPFGAPTFLAGFTSGGGDDFGLLHDASVRKDLEILDEQMKQITELQREHGQEISSMVKEHQENGGFNTQEGHQEYVRKNQELQLKQRESIRKILLPHQLDRFKQVSRQWKMQMMGMANALHHGSLADELEVSKSQKVRLREIEKEFRLELAKKTKEITEAAEQRMLEELSSEQREKLNELTGDEFKQNSADWSAPALMGPPVEPQSEPGNSAETTGKFNQ